MKKRTVKKQTGFIGFRVEPEMERQIAALAAEMGKTKSELSRMIFDKGLKAEGYRKDDERLYAMIKEAVQDIIKPHVERLASISSKATQIDSACFFLLLYLSQFLNPQDDPDAMSVIAERARKLGIQYLQHKGDVDAFIGRANQKMRDEI